MNQASPSTDRVSIFLGVSGDRSMLMATEVREWLYKLFPKAIRVWTALDIDHRDGWFQELILNLERCDIAIMCVTRESAFSRWLNFEAGFTHAARSRCRMVPLLLEDTDDAEGFDLVTTLGNKSPLKELHVERVDKTAAWKIVAHIVNLLNGRIEIAPAPSTNISRACGAA